MVVVGAGVAGLVATAELTATGASCVCLEARDRIGGRLLSVAIAGGALDLGATWFWPGERRVERLVRELGLAVHGQQTSGAALVETPEGTERLSGNPFDVPAHRFSDGAHGLAAALAGRSPAATIRVSTPVSRVEYDGRAMVVVALGERVQAEHVVLAVPPALAARSIAFHPALPDRLLGVARQTPVWMGAVAKVVAHYTYPFWRTDGLAGSAISHTGPLRELHDMSGPGGYPAALFGFVPAGSNRPAPTVDAVIGQLVRLFGPQAAAPTRVLVQDWSAESYTSPPGVESLNAYQFFGDPLYAQPALNGRLHWATTETAGESPGHIEGALAAAERAVTAVGAALRLSGSDKDR